jgi:hypothetical protein
MKEERMEKEKREKKKERKRRMKRYAKWKTKVIAYKLMLSPSMPSGRIGE